MVSPNETVIVVSLATEVGDTSGMINICIPHVVLEPIIPNLSAHYWMQTEKKKRDPESYEKISKNLQSAFVETKSILGSTTINIDEFLRLNQNDIITLNQSIDQPLTMKVNDQPKFYVQPGTRRNKVSVQVLEEIKRGEQL